MKKLISFILTAALISTTILFLNGCHNSSDKTGSSTANTETTDYTSSEMLSDTESDYIDASFFDKETDINLVVSVANDETELTKKQIKRFQEHYPTIKFSSIKVKEQTHPPYEITSDPENRSDIYYSLCDGIYNLKCGELMLPVDDKLAENIKANNGKITIEALTDNNTLYGFPKSYDSSYCLIYDKSVVSENDTKSLEGVLSACKTAGKKFNIDLGNGFYSSTFAITAGIICDEIDEKIIDNNISKYKDYDEDEAVKILAAFSSLMKKYSDTIVNDEINTIDKNTSVAAGISGFFNIDEYKKIYGENTGLAKLPTINVSGKNKQMLSTYGFQFMCVSFYTKFPKAAQALAYYLNNETCQRERALQLGRVPSNLSVQKEAVKNPDIAAKLEQSKYSVPMINAQTNYWYSMSILGKSLYKDDWNSNDINTNKKLLKKIISEPKDEY